MICPEGNLSKSVKYVLSLAFLVSVLAAAGIGAKNIDFDFEFGEQTCISSEELENLNIKLIFEETLRQKDIPFKEITVFTDKPESHRISINKVIIRSDCEKEKILGALSGIAESLEVEVVDE